MIEEGLLLIDKKKGTPSFEVTQTIRNLTRFKRVGHLGTLDPQAVGLLPILMGRATKLVPFLIKMEKEYEGTMTLGEERDTMDSEGKIINKMPVGNITKTKIVETLESFIGFIDQIPPKYSAIKINGKASYKWALKGIDKKLASRKVFVKELDLLDADGNKIRFNIICSKGVYVRSIVSEFGKKLGVGAYLSALKRKRIGHFSLKKAIKLENAEKLIENEQVNKEIIPFDDVVDFFPKLTVKDESVPLVYNGVPCKTTFFKEQVELETGTMVNLKNSRGNLLGIVKWLGTVPPNETNKNTCCEYIRVFPPRT